MAKRRVRGAPSSAPTVDNQLLAALPEDDYARLASRLELVPVTLKQFVHRSGDVVRHVYFPGGGFFSEVTLLSGGEMVEVTTIGREGMAGGMAALDDEPVPFSTMVQAEMTTCHRLSVADFRRERDKRGAFYDLTSSYLKALTGTIMQGTACNAVHPLEQRLARWLLMAHDRIGHHEFPLTQEFVAMMLAASRPTVSLVAGTLQKAGLITYRRGRIAIVDRVGLEAASCECYATSARILRAVTRPAIVSAN